MGIQATLQNLIFKRTSSFLLAGIIGAFFFERSIDLFADTLFERINHGKLYKDIKHKSESEEE